eukprot:s2442_g8.t1
MHGEKEYFWVLVSGVIMSSDIRDWLTVLCKKDYVISVLKSPTWVEFIDKNAILFDEAEESLLEHTACFADFKALVSDLLLCHLMEVSITEEQFDRFCETGLTKHRSLHRALAEQLLAAEDFLTFKAMMSKHNAEICRVVAGDETEGVTNLAKAVVIRGLHWYRFAPFVEGLAFSSARKNSLNEGLLSTDDWQIYDDPLLGAEVSDAVDFSALEAEAKREEAELAQAIALSLSIEEERLRQMAADEEQIPDVPVTETVDGPPSPPPPPAEEGETASTASRTLPPVQAFRTNLQLWKRRASEAVQPLPKQLRGARSRMFSPPSSPKSAAGDLCGPSEEERQQRADHLRRQRDRLIEKRAKDREQQLSEFGGAAHPADKQVWAALGRRRVAELSGAQLANEAAPSHAQPESAEKLRQALTRQLLQSLAQSMVSDAEAYMDLAIGNKAWHTEVPTLMEGGMDGLTGIERGRMWLPESVLRTAGAVGRETRGGRRAVGLLCFAEVEAGPGLASLRPKWLGARTAQRLNAAKAKANAMDDEEVRRHVVALRRLLTVAQAIRPNADPSKNAG